MVPTHGDLRGRAQADFRRGQAIDDCDETVWLRVETPEADGEPWDVVSNVFDLSVYSERMRRVLYNGPQNLDSQRGGLKLGGG